MGPAFFSVCASRLFPIVDRVQTLKFDNLCQNFYQHEDLDNSAALMTATLDVNGAITKVALATGSDAGTIPLTVPSGDATAVRGVGQNTSRQSYGLSVWARSTPNIIALCRCLVLPSDGGHG